MKVKNLIFKNSFLLILFIFLTQILAAQRIDHRQGEILVRIEDGTQPERLINALEEQFARGAFNTKLITSNPYNIWSITFDFDNINEREVLNSSRVAPTVIHAQYNRVVKQRNTPDDPEYNQQWQYNNIGTLGGAIDADMDADLAWDITTGGVTAGGDTIVVCIIDDGIEQEHEDFEDNIWYNKYEIPGNDIDDDGNGYVDDYYGWNVVDENDDVFGVADHGTPVAGIIGAKGSNGKGVTGVNWDVKLMILKGVGFESDAIASYSYAYTMRKTYNETNGEKGAFVVVTNSSFGIDEGQPSEFPLWCGFYDILGEVGILSCAATANNNIDVDLAGDIPTACPSNYLISVSNLNDEGQKVFSAGYGLRTIDLGAFSEDAYTTAYGNRYGEFGGTSGASPHVAGTVALAYSVVCESLVDFYRNDPSGAALYFKSSILDGAKRSEELEGYFLTGGSLNAYNSVSRIQNFCSSCPFISFVEINLNELGAANISWEEPVDVQTYNIRFKITSESEWDTLEDVSTPVSLEDLLTCETYEVQVQGVCDEGSISDYSGSYIFTTLGCCENPFLTAAINEEEEVDLGSILVYWEDNPEYSNYFIDYRPFSIDAEEEWTSISTSNDSIFIDNLGSCQAYEFRLSAECLTGQITGFSDTLLASTNCGNCSNLDYCFPPILDSRAEWIDSINIDGIAIKSGDNNGYQDFSGAYNIELLNETPIDFYLKKGYENNAKYPEFVKIWVDFNMDGFFEEEEVILEDGPNQDDIETVFFFPEEYDSIMTKMRVALVFDTTAYPCSAESLAEYGEYEDYCISIMKPAYCNTQIDIDTIEISNTEATVYFSPIDTAFAYNVRFKKVEEGEDDWSAISVLDTFGLMSPLDECSEYVVQIRSVCPIDTSGWEMAMDTFMTKGAACMVNTEDVVYVPVTMTAFPNPFDSYVNLKINSQVADEIRINFYNLNGQLVYSRKQYIFNGENNVSIMESSSWSAGIYFARILGQEIDISHKLVKTGSY